MQAKKLADKLCDVKVLALVDPACLHSSGEKGKDTFCECWRDVVVKALVKTLAYRVAEVMAKNVRTP